MGFLLVFGLLSYVDGNNLNTTLAESSAGNKTANTAEAVDAKTNCKHNNRNMMMAINQPKGERGKGKGERGKRTKVRREGKGSKVTWKGEKRFGKHVKVH